jgi:D-alanyl-D-alanine carboxypeptidase-like protein
VPGRRYRWTVVGLLAVSSLSGCGSSGSAASPVVTPATVPRSVPVPTTAGPVPATAARPAPVTTGLRPVAAPATTAAFRYTVARVSATDLPYTWHPGCPVAPSALRMIHLSYWGFDAKPHTGAIVVNSSVLSEVVGIFRTLYDDRFPIFEVVPQDAYRGNDNAAAAADDTSGFNCRYAVAPGPPEWSVHAFGEAIDVNDVQNPYVDGSTIIPAAGAAYLDRADPRPGMAVPGGPLVAAFAAAGWQWGGRWSPGTDYQHFSLTGG